MEKFNLDDLKNDFENFQKCSIKESSEEEIYEGDYITILKEEMLTPVKCGVYFSRFDLKAIADLYGESIMVRERRRMLTDILKAVFTKEDMKRLFDIINNTIKHKTDIYKELAANFPSSKEIFKDMINKSKNFQNTLSKILKDFKGIEAVK